MTHSLRLPLFSLCLLFPLVACSDAVEDALGGGDEDRTQAAQAVDSTDLTHLEAALLMAAADETPLGGEADAMATAVAEAAETTFTPADCVSAEAVGPSVTLTFDGCSGPRGLSNLSGAANITYSVEASTSVAMSLTATNLEVNGATMTINANGGYSLEGSEHRLDLTTSGGGTAEGGTIIGRAGTYFVTWETECLTLDGQWTSTIDDDELFETAVESYRRCGAACPESGRIGYVGVDAPDTAADPLAGNGIIVTFDGDNTASFVSPTPATGEITLDCP
jgi:hypothetical protein